jgi:hypothetical protein
VKNRLTIVENENAPRDLGFLHHTGGTNIRMQWDSHRSIPDAAKSVPAGSKVL